jgi:hypothetical protein
LKRLLNSFQKKRCKMLDLMVFTMRAKKNFLPLLILFGENNIDVHPEDFKHILSNMIS